MKITIGIIFIPPQLPGNNFQFTMPTACLFLILHDDQLRVDIGHISGQIYGTNADFYMKFYYEKC